VKYLLHKADRSPSPSRTGNGFQARARGLEHQIADDDRTDDARRNPASRRLRPESARDLAASHPQNSFEPGRSPEPQHRSLLQSHPNPLSRLTSRNARFCVKMVLKCIVSRCF
jgi:hypothetical protein